MGNGEDKREAIKEGKKEAKYLRDAQMENYLLMIVCMVISLTEPMYSVLMMGKFIWYDVMIHSD